MKQLAALLLLSPLAARAQGGGRVALPFLNLPPTAQVAGLGGLTASTRDRDPALFWSNPALLNPDMDRAASLTYVAYVADIRQSTAAYAFNTEKRGRFGLGLSYVNYGSFQSFDAAGNSLGTFGVNEYALAAANARTFGKFTAGLTTKLAVSSLAGDRALALAADAGVLYRPDPKQDLTVGLVVRNAGYLLRPYPGTARAPLPLDVQLGVTVKPEHMPLRFTLTAHHLHRWNIQYLDPQAITGLGVGTDTLRARFNWADNLARHFSLGTELILGTGLRLRLGYNHLQARELRLSNLGGGAGFSFGAMVRIAQFQLDYTYATLQAAGSSNYFTLSRKFGQ